MIFCKDDRRVVGSAGVKDVPNKNVEVCYGLSEEFEHNAYMTEAVKAMCEWALKQNSVINVIVETDLEYFASQRILEHCEFEKNKQ